MRCVQQILTPSLEYQVMFSVCCEMLWLVCWPSQNSNGFPMTSSLISLGSTWYLHTQEIKATILILTGQRFSTPSLKTQETRSCIESDSPHYREITQCSPESSGTPSYLPRTAWGWPPLGNLPHWISIFPLCLPLGSLYAQIVCSEEASDESGSKELVCEAHKNTWSHQRKRKRLQQRLQNLAKPGWTWGIQSVKY